MVKSRTAQLVFQSFFVAFGLIGIAASIGFFNRSLTTYFYVYFTNLSNYLCEIIMIAHLICTIRKKEDAYTSFSPMLDFMCMMAISLTFIVYNFVLNPGIENFNFSMTSILFHVLLPLMYVANWFLFCDRKRLRWYFPLTATVAPILYFAFIFIRASHLGFNPAAPHIYPYFFMNLERLGWTGVMKWSLSMLACYVAAGYILLLAGKLFAGKRTGD